MERSDITGFGLAGGQSRRMGRAKALIPWDSGTLLSHAVANLEKVASRVFIVGGLEADDLPAPLLQDKYPGRGPLAGIHAALAHTSTDWNFVLALDLPLVTSDLLRFIVRESRDEGEVAVVPRTGGRLQPLCALFHRSLLPEIQGALNHGQLSIHRLLERLNTGIMNENSGVRTITEADLAARGFQPEMLTNVNTPEDLERVTQIASRLHV